MKNYPLKQRIVALCLILTFVIPGIAVPISPQGIQSAAAQDAREPTLRGVLGNNKAQTGLQAAIVGFASAQNFKEFVLDPIVWSLINKIIANMLQELMKWVNSGFQGDPAFITDLEGHLRDVADEAFGEFMSDQGLEALCSPFKLDVKTALNTQYQAARSSVTGGGTGANACRISDMAGNMENFLSGQFSEGGWGGMLDLTTSPGSDANKAFLEQRARLKTKLLTENDLEVTETSAKGFFKDVKICEDGLSVNGSKKNCKTGTLGNVVEARVNDALGLPDQRLAFADEFNELLAALLSQLANQMLMGVGGMLGSGGNSSYSDNSFGASGNQSFIDAMAAEANDPVTESAAGGSTGGTTGGVSNEDPSTNAIENAIAKEEEFIAVNQNIIAQVDNIEDYRDEQLRNCFNISTPSNLIDARETAENRITAAEASIIVLNQSLAEYQAADTPEERLEIMLDFQSLQGQGIGMTSAQTIQAEVDRDVTVPFAIEEFRTQIDNEARRCNATGR